MEAVLQRGPISRASISKQTGLSKQTISEIMRHLEDAGWVVETGRTAGHVGRSAVTYEVVPDAAFVAAVDLGGTKVRIGLSDLRGAIVGEAAELTRPEGGQAVVDQIARLCRETAAAAGVAGERIRIAVAGVPGAPDPATGRVRLAPNIPGFDRMDVATALEAALGCDVLLENDVNLAVQGEAWLGAAKGSTISPSSRSAPASAAGWSSAASWFGARTTRRASWASCRSAPTPSRRSRSGPAPSSGWSPRPASARATRRSPAEDVGGPRDLRAGRRWATRRPSG